jgi:O-antigen/teichoic acid export membrane protein
MSGSDRAWHCSEILGAPSVAAAFKQPELEQAMRWLFLNFIFVSLTSVQNAVLGRDLRFKTIAIRSMIAQTAGGFVGVAMALSDYDVWSLIA